MYAHVAYFRFLSFTFFLLSCQRPAFAGFLLPGAKMPFGLRYRSRLARQVVIGMHKEISDEFPPNIATWHIGSSAGCFADPGYAFGSGVASAPLVVRRRGRSLKMGKARQVFRDLCPRPHSIAHRHPGGATR